MPRKSIFEQKTEGRYVEILHCIVCGKNKAKDIMMELKVPDDHWTNISNKLKELQLRNILGRKREKKKGRTYEYSFEKNNFLDLFGEYTYENLSSITKEKFNKYIEKSIEIEEGSILEFVNKKSNNYFKIVYKANIQADFMIKYKQYYRTMNDRDAETDDVLFRYLFSECKNYSINDIFKYMLDILHGIIDLSVKY